MSDEALSYAEQILLEPYPEKVASVPAGGFASAAEAAEAAAAAGLPLPLSWPVDLRPTAQPLNPAPAGTDTLARADERHHREGLSGRRCASRDSMQKIWRLHNGCQRSSRLGNHCVF